MGFKELHRNIKIRIITSFLTRIVGTMIFPFMAIYFSLKFGQVLAGILLIVNVLISLFIGFYGGYIADRIGRKKIMVTAQGIQVAAIAVMAIANSPFLDSAWLTFLMMLVSSVSSGLMNPAAEAMLIDVSTPENRKFMYSLNYWSINLSIALGAIIGGLLFKSHRFELFLVLTAVSIFTWVLVTYWMTESFESKRAVITSEKRNVLRDVIENYSSVMHDKTFMLYVLASICILSLEFQMHNYIGVRLDQEFDVRTLTFWNGFSFEMTGIRMLSWLSTENTVLVVLLTIWLTKQMKRFNDMKVFFVGLMFYTVGYAIVGISNSMSILMGAVLIYTIGELLYVPIRQSFLADIADDDKRSSYMAMNGLVFQVAKIAGSLGLTIGAFLPSWTMGSLYLMTGLLGMVLFYQAFARFYKKETVLKTTA
ncbi:MFS transporter [Fictibacillus nanhaiensis]|uniref:MDR family MFS transporter n=1 Tax=Fictibacillus nanhaiensis TaxID=742169 RepID=UPI001C94E75E|nr:MFS transporter [Fictibacillus nanhaiensis]MBY6036495.1 MFS transporter [Fictibacillus nanhaiensis]